MYVVVVVLLLFIDVVVFFMCFFGWGGGGGVVGCFFFIKECHSITVLYNEIQMWAHKCANLVVKTSAHDRKTTQLYTNLRPQQRDT